MTTIRSDRAAQGDAATNEGSQTARTGTRPAPAFEMKVRVYYEDTDAGGIVYHANYLRYFERARTDWLRSLGAAHTEIDARHGVLLVVRDMSIDFQRPARLDDELVVDVRVLESRRATLRLEQVARHATSGETLVAARMRVAAIDRGTQRATGFPRWLADRFARAADPASAPSGALDDPIIEED
jgi:acyl-CoA thioester hydrolase